MERTVTNTTVGATGVAPKRTNKTLGVIRCPPVCRFHTHKSFKKWSLKSKSSTLDGMATALRDVPAVGEKIGFQGVHHVGLLCEDLEKSLVFYKDLLGLEINPDRPNKKLPYRGAWLWIGTEMIHLMELPNPDPMQGRPEHGGRDRHVCVGVESIAPLTQKLKEAGVQYTESMSGRPAIFFRDPDMNCLECVEMGPWR